jgi:hypothetical protein
MSDNAFHAPTPHVHDPATDLDEDETADSTPAGGFLRAEDEADDDTGRIGEPGSGDAAIPTTVPTSPDL